MPRVTHVKKARKARPEHSIEVGDSYYHWSFAFGPTCYSKEYPKPWELTQSAFLQSLYQLQDRISNLTAESIDDLQSQVEEITSEIENLGSECQDSLDNMPEQLQDAPGAGETLTTRIEAMETWGSDLEGVDISADEDTINEEAEMDIGDAKDFDTKKAYQEALEEAKAEKLQEHLQEIVGEIQGFEPDIY